MTKIIDYQQQRLDTEVMREDDEREEFDAHATDLRNQLANLGPYDPPSKRESIEAELRSIYRHRYGEAPIINGVRMTGADARRSGGAPASVLRRAGGGS